MKILIVIGITLLFTSLACETKLSESGPLVNTSTTTEEAVESIPTTQINQGKANTMNETAEEVIKHIKERLDTETDCGFLLEKGPWLTEYKKPSKPWSVSVAWTDNEGSESYSWKYFAFNAVVVASSGQDNCYLEGSSIKGAF